MLSDRFGDLRRAVLIVLPGALIVSAALWLALVACVRRDREQAGN